MWINFKHKIKLDSFVNDRAGSNVHAMFILGTNACLWYRHTSNYDCESDIVNKWGFRKFNVVSTMTTYKKRMNSSRMHMSRLWVALRFGRGVSRNFQWIRNYESAHRVRKTLSSCQQNPILFGRAGLTTPTRLGVLFQLTFSVTPWRNGNYDSNTKCKGCRYGSNDSSRCWLHCDSDAINSIITQKQL